MKALLAAVAVTFPALALPSLAQAHPDHSNEPVTLWHALTEPDHAAMIALGLAVVAAVVIKSRRSRRDAANEDAAHKDPRL